MPEEDLYLPRIDMNNRVYRSIKNVYGKSLPTTVGIYATTGHGKFLCEGRLIEEWRKATGGVVIFASDPKNEAEGTFVQYPAEATYQVNQLNQDGIEPRGYPCKIYHPFTFNVPKGYLPEISFFTIPISGLSTEELSILAETSYESESIRLLKRVGEDLGRNEGLFTYLHKIQKIVEGKRSGKKQIADPSNFYLKVGGGTSKSITEVASLLNPFKNNYFLRKETCPNKLNWQEILTDTKNVHVFISMWLKDEKLQSFLVLSLIKQIIENRHFAKKPILIVIPEILKQCPRFSQGYKFFLSNAIAEALVTVRNMGRGISVYYDSQNWSETSDVVKGGTKVTLFGQLATKDLDVVCKSLQYKREIREKLMRMDKNSFFKYGEEEYDPDRYFMPSHAVKEPEYNWIEMYRNTPELYPKMKRYDELVKYMRDEIEEEELEIKENVEKEIEQEELEQEEKENKKSEKSESKETPKEDKNLNVIKEQAFKLSNNGLSFREVGKELKVHHVTAKKYVLEWKKKLEEPQDFTEFKGEGVMPEELGTETESLEIANPIIEESSSEIQYRKVHAKNVEDEYNMQIATEGEDVVEKIESMSSVNNFKPKDVKPIDLEFDYLEDVDKSEDSEDVQTE